MSLNKNIAHTFLTQFPVAILSILSGIIITTTTNHVLRNLDEFVETIKNNGPPDLDKIQGIKTSVESLNEFMNSFKLMQTDINTKG